MVRLAARISTDAQPVDRIAILLIWLFGLAPIVFPAAVFASATVMRPPATFAAASATPIAALHKPFGPGPAKLAFSGTNVKLELRASQLLQLGGRSAAASIGAPRTLAAIPGGAAIRIPIFAPARSGAPPATLSISQTGWVMKKFASVKVLDGLRLGSGSLVIALAGVKPLAADATCRRLDGVMENCLARATSRLEVLVEGRPVSCEVYRQPGPDGKRGRCMAGKIDLAADLVRNGLAQRS